MLFNKNIEGGMKAERMNGRDVLYYFGWNYGWKDGYVKVNYISNFCYRATITCEYGTLDSILLASITARDILNYLKETGLVYTVELENNYIVSINLTIPVEDGIWEGYDNYQEELMKIEEEEQKKGGN